MNDEKLIEAVAKIAELEYKDGKVLYYGDWIDPLKKSLRARALCHELLVIYGVTFDFYIDQGTKYFFGYIEDENDNVITIPDCDNLKKFIFLAIEASKE
jgi:hypothetical protein